MDFRKSLDTLLKNPSIKNLNLGNLSGLTAAMGASMDWAYRMTLSEHLPPGISNSYRLAEKYLSISETPDEACRRLIRHELPKVAGAGFATSFGGMTTLPVNVACVLLLQLRLVNAIACIGGKDPKDDEVKRLAYLSLLGSRAGKFAKQKILDGALNKALQEIAKKLAPGMMGKNLASKSLPIISGIIGTSLDTAMAYTVLRTAKKMFIPENLIVYANEIPHPIPSAGPACHPVFVQQG